MHAPRQRVRAIFPRANSRRVLLSATLLLAYAVLSAEAIHCQYFPSAQHKPSEHSAAPAPETDHAIHCLVANHAGSVTLNADDSAPLPSLTPTSRSAAEEHLFPASRLTRLAPVRAPP